MIELDLLDQCFAHCNFSNNPLPPVQVAKDIRWNRELNSGSKYLFATDSQIFNLERVINSRRIAWLLEPMALIPNWYYFVHNNAHQFEFILSHDCDFFKGVPNYRWVPFGGCWIPESSWNIGIDSLGSTKPGISIIASGKRMLEGHQLRHHIIEKFRDQKHQRIDTTDLMVFGNGYRPIESKLEAACAYQIVIENDSKNGYFTEKLIDCILSGSIPIYWGCKNLQDYGFNLDGMLYAHSKEELELYVDCYLKGAIDNCAIYERAYRQNIEAAQKFILAENYISEHYKDLLVRA